MTVAHAFLNPFQWMVIVSLWCFVGLLVAAFTRVRAAVVLISTENPIIGTAVLVTFIALWPLAFMSIWLWVGYKDWQSEKRAILKSRFGVLRRREKKAALKKVALKYMLQKVRGLFMRVTWR